MERFIEEYAAYVSRPENALLGVEILTEAIRNPTIAEVFGRNRNRLIDALVQCLCEGGKRGAFRQFADARAVAFTILDALEGNGLRSLSRKAPSEETIETIQKLLFQGLKA